MYKIQRERGKNCERYFSFHYYLRVIIEEKSAAILLWIRFS